MSLDFATFLLQWATGASRIPVGHHSATRGLDRLRVADAGVFGGIALVGAIVGFRYDAVPVRDIASIGRRTGRGLGVVEFLGAQGGRCQVAA